jgi:hypothetical protein
MSDLFCRANSEQTRGRANSEPVTILTKVCKAKPPDWKGGQSGGVFRYMEFSEFLLPRPLGFR